MARHSRCHVTAPAVAMGVGLTRRICQRWVRRYNDEGLAGLDDIHQFQIIFYNEKPTIFALAGHPDRLVFGTTTGNLFVSDDRGDHWECVTHHIPPVYSVRFG